MTAAQTRAAAPAGAAGATRPAGGRWLALLVVCSGMLMIVLDSTIVNVALPAIQRDLRFSQSNLAWVINAYLITFGGLLLLSGRLGDLIGPKRVFVAGLCVFAGASLLCGIAHDQYLLIAARFLQGAGGAMTSGVILGMIVTMFPDVPITMLTGVLSLWLTPRLILRFGPKQTMLAGVALLAAGLVSLTRVPSHGQYAADVLPAMVLLGTGNGLAILSAMTLAMADAAPEDSGLAPGMVNTTIQLGGAFGVAVLASLSTARTDTALGHGKGATAALISGYHLAFWVAAGTMIAALVIAFAVIRARPAEPTPAP